MLNVTYQTFLCETFLCGIGHSKVQRSYQYIHPFFQEINRNNKIYKADQYFILAIKWKHFSLDFSTDWNTYHIPAFQGYPTIVQPGNIMYDPYHRPMLHNHYLPPQPVRPIPSPTNTNQIPDRTYLPANAPRPQPADQPGTFDFGNRLGENVFAFDIVYDPNVDTNYILHRGPRPTYSFQGTFNDQMDCENILLFFLLGLSMNHVVV